MSKNKKNSHVDRAFSTSEFENTLLEFFQEAPLPNVDIDIERDKNTGRELDGCQP